MSDAIILGFISFVVILFVLVIYAKEQYSRKWKWKWKWELGNAPSPQDKSDPLTGEYYRYLGWQIGKIREASTDGVPNHNLVMDFFQKELARVWENREQADLLLELMQSNFQLTIDKINDYWDRWLRKMQPERFE